MPSSFASSAPQDNVQVKFGELLGELEAAALVADKNKLAALMKIVVIIEKTQAQYASLANPQGGSGG